MRPGGLEEARFGQGEIPHSLSKQSFRFSYLLTSTPLVNRCSAKDHLSECSFITKRLCRLRARLRDGKLAQTLWKALESFFCNQNPQRKCFSGADIPLLIRTTSYSWTWQTAEEKLNLNGADEGENRGWCSSCFAEGNHCKIIVMWWYRMS